MLLVRVLIPFHRRETDTDQLPGDEIAVSLEELARIRAVNVNMVLVLGEVQEPAPEPEAEPEEIPEVEPEAEPEKPKKGKSKK